MKNLKHSLLPFALLITAASCSAPGDEGPYHPPLVPTEEVVARIEPWTEAFLSNKVLIADIIRLRGPLQLIDHVAVVQDPERVAMEIEGRETALHHIYRAKGGVLEPEIKAHLDGWALIASQELSVIHDATLDRVILEAQGGVALIDVASSQTERSEDFAKAEPLALPAQLQGAKPDASEQVVGQPASSGGD